MVYGWKYESHEEVGENDCYWNINGICTNPEVTGKKNVDRDLESNFKCIFTSVGVSLCKYYKKIG